MRKKEMESEAVRMIKRDHKRISDLLFHFEQSEQPSHKLSFAETAMNEVAIHSVIEDEYVYPLLEDEDKKKLTKHVQQSREQHDEIDQIMAMLVNRDYDDRYDELFGKMSKMLHQHFKKEEEDLLPMLDSIASDDLAVSMNNLKDELLKYDRPNGKDSSPQAVLFEKLRARRRSA